MLHANNGTRLESQSIPGSGTIHRSRPLGCVARRVDWGERRNAGICYTKQVVKLLSKATANVNGERGNLEVVQETEINSFLVAIDQTKQRGLVILCAK